MHFKHDLIIYLFIIISISIGNCDQGLNVTKEAVLASTGEILSEGDTVKPGSTIYYRISLENTGLDEVREVCLTDWLPPEVQFVKILDLPTDATLIVQPNLGIDPKSPLHTETVTICINSISPGENDKKIVTIAVKAPEKEAGPIALYNQLLVRSKSVKQNIFEEFRLMLEVPYEFTCDFDNFYKNYMDIKPHCLGKKCPQYCCCKCGPEFFGAVNDTCNYQED